MLVLDGNMKNSWEVYYAIQVGHTEFNGLPGSVRTGCPNTPSYKSQYCAIHAPITAIPHQIEFSEDGNPKPANPTTPSEERQVAIIIGKHITRKSTFFIRYTICVHYIYHVYANRTQAKKINYNLNFHVISGKGHHNLH